MKYLCEETNRHYIVVNTGGHGGQDGQNPSSSLRNVQVEFADEDRKSATTVRGI
jgi:hypothetical protein